LSLLTYEGRFCCLLLNYSTIFTQTTIKNNLFFTVGVEFNNNLTLSQVEEYFQIQLTKRD